MENLLDDTAYLDDVIARHLHLHLVDVIPRSIKKSVDDGLEGEERELDGTKYLDEVIARACPATAVTRDSAVKWTSGIEAEEGEVFLPDTTLGRQQIADTVVAKFLTAKSSAAASSEAHCFGVATRRAWI